MTVDIASVPYGIAGVAASEADNLVNERFSQAQTLAENQVTATQAYLNALSALFATATMPEVEVDYEFQDISLESDLVAPEAPDMTIGVVDAPQSPTVESITVPTITIPSYTLVAPTNGLEYNEPIYQSDLQDVLKIALQDFIENGGTGLGSTIEAALWARARARQDIINERTYNEAEEYFASRGYTIPPGALGGRLTEALAEQTRADALLNDEISIKQAELARAQSEYTMNAGITLEGQDKEKFSAMANRTLEAAKAAVQVIIDIFNVKVQEYIAEIEGAKIKAEAEKIKVDAKAAANESAVNLYAADIEKYKSQVIAELGIVEQIGKVYGYQIAGYEADAKVAASELDAQIKVYQGNIDQANNQTTLSLKEAEMTIQSYLGALQLSSEAIQAGGNISAQIAASALSAVNASATISKDHNTGFSVGYDYDYSLQNSASLVESHRYDETAV